MTTTEPATIVQHLWNYYNVLHDDGVSYGNYAEKIERILAFVSFSPDLCHERFLFDQKAHVAGFPD